MCRSLLILTSAFRVFWRPTFEMSALYVRLNLGFYSNRKTARLRALIGDDAFWIPPRLWAYAAQNQPDGDFSGYSSEELAMLLGCDKHASSIRQALLQAGFLDEEGKIHDWEEHNGYHKAYADRAKKAAEARWEKEKNQKKEKKDKEKTGEDIDKETSIASSMLEAFRVRIGSWFKRRESTAWSEKELKALKKVLELKTPDEDVALLERHYTDPNALFLRQDIVTLLNNWNAEIDRARKPRNGENTQRNLGNGVARHRAELADNTRAAMHADARDLPPGEEQSLATT